MNDNVKKFVIEAIRRLINHTASDLKVNSLVINHKKKIHFIPIRYRIFGGLLQSMNIQFGNFIEELLHTIVENEENLKILEPSGNRSIELPLTVESDRLIDEYITERQNDTNYSQNLFNAFNTLLDQLFEIEQNNQTKEIKTKHDIDVLFKTNNNNLIYLEVKYNDDHDTGKYVDINRKFIKTYIGLCNIKNIYDKDKFKPILYFLTPKIMKGNIYLPEPENIYRGDRLFNEYFSLTYKDLDDFMREIGDNEEIKLLFDNLYHKIRNEIEI
ncbi:MAG: hypothetical protein Kow0068_24460 [Marinilabiliales bacterium]